MPKIDFQLEHGPITHQNIDTLKLLINKTFPFGYSKDIYLKIVHEYSNLSFLGKIHNKRKHM